MKTPLSAKSVTWLYLLAIIGGLIGLAAALFVLTRVDAMGLVDSRILASIGAAIALLTAFLLFRRWREWRSLKQVSMDEQHLYVSGYSDPQEIAVPLSEIASVKQWRGKGIRPVTVTFRSPSRFGGKIRFQPLRKQGEVHLAVHEDEVVKDLRAAIEKPA